MTIRDHHLNSEFRIHNSEFLSPSFFSGKTGLNDPKNLIKVLEGDDMGTFVHS